MKNSPFFRRAVTGLIAILAGPIQAATVTWDNDLLSSAWSTGANWDGGAEPGAGSDVVFGTPIPGGLGTITLAAGELALSLSFQADYTLTAGGLALGAGGISTDSLVTATINTAITAASGFAKNGDGLLILGGSNTITGGTQINDGTLRVTNVGALGGAANVTAVNSGGTLEVAITSLDRAITLNSGGTLLGGAGSFTNNGKVTVTAGATVNLSGSATASDVFTVGNGANDWSGGVGSLTIVGGTGSVRLAQASDYQGEWRLDTGVLQLGSATALGSNTVGTVTLNGGTLAGRLASATNFATGSQGANLSLTASSTILSDRSSAGAGVAYTFGALAMGTHTLSVAPGANATTAASTAAVVVGNVTLSGNPTFAVDDAGSVNGKLTTGSLIGGGIARTVAKTGTGDLAITGGATDLVAGSQLNGTGGGSVEGLFATLGAGASITPTALQNPFGEAAIDIEAGTLRLAADGDATATAQTFNIGNAVTLGGAVTLEVDRRTTGSNKTFSLASLGLDSGTVLSVSANNTFKLAVSGTTTIGGSVTIQGATGKTSEITPGTITESAVGSMLTFAGGGATAFTVNLNNAAGWTGGTNITGGTVIVSADNALDTTAATTITGGTLRMRDIDAAASNTIALNGGTLDLRSNTSASFTFGSLTLGGNATLNVANDGSGSNQTLTLGTSLAVSGNRTLTVTNANGFTPNLSAIALAGDLTLSNAITVRAQGITQDATPRKLLKDGAGTLELEVANSFSGGSEVLAGILQVENTGALGGGTATLGGTGGSAAATLRLSVAGTYTNALHVRTGSSGTATINAQLNGTAWDGAITLDRTAVFDATSGFTINGQLTGAGNFTKAGNGTLVLANATNSFGDGTAGSVTVSNGVLSVADDGAFGSAANGVTFTGGDLLVTMSFATARTLTLTSIPNLNIGTGVELTLNSPFAGAAAFTKIGTGTLILAPGVDNSARGAAATTISAGTVRVQGASGLSAAGVVNFNANGTLELLRDANTNFANPLNITGVGTVHVDRAAGGVGVNGTHTLGTVAISSTGTLNVTGANGYGLTVGAVSATTNATISNAAAGVLTLPSVDGTSASPRIFTFDVDGGDIVVSGALTQGGAGAYSLTKTGAGTMELGSGIAWTGALTVTQGVLDYNGLTHSPTTVTMGGGPAASTSSILTGGITMGGNFSYSAGNDPGTATFTGPLNLGSATRTFAIGNSSGTALELEIIGVISENAPGTGLTKTTASSVMRMSGAGNTYTGLTTVSAGTLELNKSSGDAIGIGGLSIGSGSDSVVTLLAAGQINDAASVTLTAIPNGNTLLDLAGFSETVGAVTLTSSTSDVVRITTGASGTLVLGGDLTFNNDRSSGFVHDREVLITGTGTETTPVADGNLDLGGVLRTISVNTTVIGANAAFSNATIETAIHNGGINKTGARTLFLANGGNDFAGGVNITNGAVSIALSSALGSGDVTLANTGTDSAALILSGGGQTVAADIAVNGTGSGSSIVQFTGGTSTTGTFSGTATLTSALTLSTTTGTVNGTTSATLDYTGLITDGVGAFGLVKTGGGIAQLAAGNTFSGGTTITDGTLRIGANSALGDTAAALTFNGTGIGGALQTTASFSTARDLTFTGAGNLRADAGTTLEYSGVLSGAGDVGVTGGGTVIWSGSGGTTGNLAVGDFATSPSGTTPTNGTVLAVRGTVALPTGNISLTNGGVLELGSADFTNALGTGAGQVQLSTTESAGFAAYGADRTVNIGGAAATLTWGAATFLGTGAASSGDLILGSATATHTVIFQNALELNTGTFFQDRDVNVVNGAAAIDAELAGAISKSGTGSTDIDLNGAGAIVISGAITGGVSVAANLAGTVTLTNAANTFSGDVFVSPGATLVVAGGSSLGNAQSIFIDPTATLDHSAVPAPVSITAGNFIQIGGTLIGSLDIGGLNSELGGDGIITGDLQMDSGSFLYQYNTSAFSDGTSFDIGGDFTLVLGATLGAGVGGTVGGVDYDQLLVGGAVTLGGTLDLFTSGGFIPTDGDIFYLLLNEGTDSISGIFDGLAEGAQLDLGGLLFNITYLANGDGGAVGNDIALTFDLEAVPEPATAAWGLAVSLLALARRRRERR